MSGPYTIQLPVQGQPISSSLFGIAVRDAINDLDTRVGTMETSTRICKLRQAAVQSINSAADTILTTWGTEDNDPNAWHDPVTNNTRITPDRVGWYNIGGIMVWEFQTVLQYCEMFFRKNGTVVERSSNIQFPTTGQNNVSKFGGTLVIPLSVNNIGDYFEMGVKQVSTGAVAVNTNGTGTTSSARFWCQYAGPL